MRKRKFIVLVTTIVTAYCLLICFMCVTLGKQEIREMQVAATASAAARSAAEAAQERLVEQYGAEITEVIEEFEIRWDRPHTVTEAKRLITWPLSDYWKSGVLSVTMSPSKEVFITQVEIIHLEILEYMQDHFRAAASMTITMQRLSWPEETPLTPAGQHLRCAVYAFALEDGIWKLAGKFEVPLGARGYKGIVETWERLPEAQKQVLGGKLPEGPICRF